MEGCLQIKEQLKNDPLILFYYEKIFNFTNPKMEFWNFNNIPGIPVCTVTESVHQLQMWTGLEINTTFLFMILFNLSEALLNAKIRFISQS